MVAEGLVLSGLGGIAGLVVGQLVMGAFVARLDIGADLPFAFDVVLATGFPLEFGALEPAQPEIKEVSNVNDTTRTHRRPPLAGFRKSGTNTSN